MDNNQTVSKYDEYYKMLEDNGLSRMLFDTYMNDLNDTLATVLGDQKLNLDNIPVVVARLMVRAESFANLNGKQKKVMLNVLLKYYIDTELSNEEAVLVNQFYNHALSSMVDIMVAIDKREISINTIQSTANCCMSGIQLVLRYLKNMKLKKQRKQAAREAIEEAQTQEMEEVEGGGNSVEAEQGSSENNDSGTIV